MVWEQLSINKPHLVYLILGGFTTIFMLVSLFIKEKLYIGEASVATVCGLIFGPHAANLINPLTWGNTDQITLEFSRIVLVVQCFAVGVELPKSYMERHWRSVVLLLLPVMTWGWLFTSLTIWWMIEPITWLESLAVAACVTATDPVLASSVVGKGKFAKRVPKHIRDLLSCESGCNDGMAFPFIYLALYLIHYHLDAAHVSQHWFLNTILYECVWGATYGVLIGYLARHAIKWAERRGIIDRESFLVFYFVLALFCAGSGALLGMDDLLVGFAAGVGFSNDGWFTEKTEESHVSNVIDLLLNLTYFVYLGTIIPWEQFNSHQHGLDAWRLVVIAIFVLLFRRIPIMLALKPIIPDIKTWREALFCGHFGPIGVGAIFVAILARAELETDSTTPLAVLPDPSDPEYVLIYVIWPITTFLVITSIVVHGSSIAVFTLGRRINTLTMTLSFTQDNSNSSRWMDRLPRIASRSKSEGTSYASDYSEDEKANFAPGTLGPQGIPQLHLRRQKEDDKPYGQPAARRRNKKRRSDGMGGPISESAINPWRASDSALSPQPSGSDTLNEKSERPSPERQTSDQLYKLHSTEDGSDLERKHKRAQKEEGRRGKSPDNDGDAEIEVFEEDNHMILEDEEGNVLDTLDTEHKTPENKANMIEETRDRLRADTSGKFTKHKHEPHAKDEGSEAEEEVKHAVEHPEKHLRDQFKRWTGFGKRGGGNEEAGPAKKEAPGRKRGPAHAYQIGNTIIVEDEDGEVIQKIDLPREDQEPNKYMRRMGTWVGLARRPSQQAVPVSDTAGVADDIEDTSTSSPDKDKQEAEDEQPTQVSRPPKTQRGQTGRDDGLRMVISNTEQYGMTGLRKPRPGQRPDVLSQGGGRRMSTQDFVKHMQNLDRPARQQAMKDAGVGAEAREAINQSAARRATEADNDRPLAPDRAGTMPLSQWKSPIQEDHAAEAEAEANAQDYFSVAKKSTPPSGSRNRAQSDASGMKRGDSYGMHGARADADEAPDVAIPAHDVRASVARHGEGKLTAADRRRERYNSAAQSSSSNRIPEIDEADDDTERETAAEKRRRLAALGVGAEDSDSSEDEAPRVQRRAIQEPGMEDARLPSEVAVPVASAKEREQQAEPQRRRVQWGGETRGAVRGKGGDDGDAHGGEHEAGSSGGGLGKKFKGFMNR